MSLAPGGIDRFVFQPDPAVQFTSAFATTSLTVNVTGLGEFTMPSAMHSEFFYIMPQPITSGRRLPIFLIVANKPVTAQYTLQMNLVDALGSTYASKSLTLTVSPPSTVVQTERIMDLSILLPTGIFNISAKLSDVSGNILHELPLASYLDVGNYTATTVVTVNPVGSNTTGANYNVSFAVPPEGAPFPNIGVLRLDYANPKTAYYNIWSKPFRLATQQLYGFNKWVYGDNSLAALRVLVRDSTNQVFQFSSTPSTVNWRGWKLVYFDWNSVSHYGGVSTGIPVYPLTVFEHLLLDPINSALFGSSTIYFSAPFAVYRP